MGDVSIKVTGVPITPIGCTITYGHNMIPYAVIPFDPSRSDIIGDVDSHRGADVTIEIETTKGNLTFNGIFDGFSFTQTPGGFSYQAVVKSKFQKLLYIYPKLLGLHPSSLIVKRFDTTEVSLKSQGGLAVFGNIDLSGNIVDAYLSAIDQIIEAQLQQQLDPDISDAARLIDLLKNPGYKASLAHAKNLLKGVDSSAIDDLEFDAAADIATEYLTELIEGSEDTLWNTLLSGLTSMGCTIIIGNEQAFIVPENTFLKMPHKVPTFQEVAKDPNTLYPAQFNSLVFNDNGYKDVGYVMLISNEATETLSFPSLQMDMGLYSDPKATKAGVLILNAPYLFSLALSGYLLRSSPKLKQNLIDKDGHIKRDPTPNEANEIAQEIKKSLANGGKLVSDIRKKFDQWAQIKYFQAKYGDRTGSVTSEFNPNWCPGTTGTVFTRYPSINIDFYVDSVQHTIQLSPDNQGTALTTVSFSGGRAGVNPDGFDGDGFFNYTVDKMKEVQKNFVDDTTGGK